MAEDSEEDLYGDIDESPVLPPSSTTSPPTSAPGSHQVTAAQRGAPTPRADDPSHPRSLVEEVSFLQDKVGRLEGENEVLKRNMGTLYRTATAEIQRKDKEILRLTTELDRLKLEK